MRTGDWVTFSKEYAKQSVEGVEKVHNFKVKAKDVIFAGDDINEFGYYPKSQLKDIWERAEGNVLDMQERRVRTFKDMEDAAQELGVDSRKLLQDVSNSRITADEVVALKNNIKTQSERMKTLNDELAHAQTNTKKIELEEQVANVEAEIDASLRKLVKGNTEAGRAIVANRIFAKNTLDPAFWYQRAVRELGDKSFTKEHQQAIDDLIKKQNIAGLANFVSLLRKPSMAEKAITLWKVGLLTGLKTFERNILGNTTMRVLEDIKDIPSWLYDVMGSVVTGKRTKSFTPIGKAIAEIEGFKRGAKDAWDYILHGVDESQVMKKYDIPRNVQFDSALANVYTKSVFRSLGAGDKFFKNPAFRRSLYEQAYLQAKQEGLKRANFKERVRQLMLSPDDETVAIAINAAEYSTFMGENKLATAISAAERAMVNKTKSRAGEVIVRAGMALAAPFRRTPTNIAESVLEYSPAGFVQSIFKGMTGAGQREIVENLGRATTGTGLIVAGVELARRGMLTGEAPNSQSEKADFYARGKQPYSILIDGKWRRIQSTSPIGNLLTLGADFHDLSQEKRGADLAVSTVGAGVKGLTEMTFLKGMSGMLKATTQPERSENNFLQQTIGSLVPTIIGDVASVIDPTLKVPGNLSEAIQQKLPGLRGGVPTRRDIFGEPAVSGTKGIVGQMFDPFSSSEKVEDPVLNEARKVGMTIGMPSKTISGIKMNPHEYSVYQEYQGKNLYRNLKGAINSSEYKNLSSKTEKKDFLRQVRREVRSKINDTVFVEIMKNKFNFDTKRVPNPAVRNLLDALSDMDAFKRASEEKKSKLIQSYINDMQN